MNDSRNAERDQQLIEALDPDSARMLFPEKFPEPLRVTLEYPALDEARAERLAAALARAADHTTSGERAVTTFTLAEVEALHEVFALVEAEFGSARVDVLVNNQDLPMARELWLPLFWSLRA